VIRVVIGNLTNFENVCTTAGIFAFALILLVQWLIDPKQNQIQKTWRNCIRITLRLAIVITLLHGLFAAMGFPAWRGYVGLALFDAVLTAVGIPMPFMWVTSQWILGWPGFNEWRPDKLSILTPTRALPPFSPHDHRESENSRCKVLGHAGVVVTRLAPTGKIRVNDELYAARSDGRYIETDTRVQVTGQDAFGTHLVEPLAPTQQIEEGR
ncbi:MAG: hypothetical protein KJ060_12095, partial [Candidatus Hydrogenedentes bacterium]|nr:hypothetical protein [Candidatus Hydrogenedentota bacterium]